MASLHHKYEDVHIPIVFCALDEDHKMPAFSSMSTDLLPVCVVQNAAVLVGSSFS